MAGWRDTARIYPFTHSDTEAAGLIFSHYAYGLASQVQFKEDYYGYAGAVSRWRQLQKVDALPVRLSDYFGWVADETLVDHVERRTIGKKVVPVQLEAIVAKDSDMPVAKQLHVVIDGVIFQLQAQRPQGISRVWRNLISGLRQQMPDARITVLQRNGSVVPLDKVALRKVAAFEWGNDARLDEDDEMLRRVCSELGADIFLSTYYTRAPGVRNLVMIHDLIPEITGMDLLQPEWLAKQRVIETADGYLNVSEATQNDLRAQYPYTANRPMTVAHNGCDAHFRQPQAGETARLCHALGLSKPYILLVGNRQGYKNGPSLFSALAKLPVGERPMVLCAGGELRLSAAEKKFQNDLEIKYAGPLNEIDLNAAYGGAEALCVPSLYEGFGLPVVEAMACGCPVIAHPSPAVAEIGGDAVRYADFSSPDNIRSALRDVRNAERRAEFRKKGLARAKCFDWSHSCREISHFIRERADNPTIKLTAIVSTYNAAGFIKGCLEDLEQQTIAGQLEIIVIDSASAQDEAAVVRDFQGRYANIKYIRTPLRENVYKAWNRGIKFALGQYITNANTDDRHRPDAYEQMVGVLEGNRKIALVYADVIKTITPNETFRHCTPTGLLHWCDWDRQTLLRKGCFIGPQPVWRKKVHQTYGYFDESLEVSSDFEFWLRISQTNEFYHISKPLGLYLDRPDSIEHANGLKKRLEDQKILQHYRHSTVSDKKELTRGGNFMNSPETILQAAEHLIQGGYKEAAFWVMEKLLVDFPGNPRLHSVMAAIAYDQSDMQSALLHYTQAARLVPGNAHYLKALGDFLYVVHKDAQGALRQYEKTLKVNPDSIEALIMAGHVCISLHRYADAAQYYQHVLRLDPHNSEVQPYLDKINSANDFQQTRSMSADALYDAALAEAQNGDRQEAVSLLEQLLAMDNTHALAHNDLGVLSYESGDMQAALAHYKKAADLMPENENLQKNLADFYWVEMKDHQRAMETYVKALKLDPQDVELHLSCGQICLAIGKEADARDFFNTALQVEPWNEDARQLIQRLEQVSGNTGSHGVGDGYYVQGKAKASAGDLQGAIADLRQVLEKSPGSAEINNELGVLYYEAGEKDNALRCYEKAVQLDPKVPNYQKNLADFFLFEKNRARDAMRLYLSVLEDNPEDVEALNATGMICTLLDKPNDAKHFFYRVLEIEPLNPDAQGALRNLQTGRQTGGIAGIRAAG